MPSTYTLNNGIELIGTGEQSGTWGDTTNTNLELLDTALDGQITVTLASAGTSGSPNDLPISDGAASNGRNRMVIFNDGGDLGATAYVQLTPNDAEKIIYVRNDLSGSRSIILFQGTYSASNDYEVPAGTTAVIFFDGAGSGAVAANVFNNAYFDSLRLGSVSVTAILDEDNMASDSATALATQQSIKAYVDTQVGANNELSEVLANGNTTGGTDISVSSGDDITFADSSKAIFGAGSDLQIYHDGSNSYISDQGTGNLKILGTSMNIQSAAGENYIEAVNNAHVKLFYDGGEKIATTSSGVDITGTAVTDGLTVDGNTTFNSLVTIGSGSYFVSNATNGFRFNNSGDTAQLLYIKNTGEAVFNENGIDYDFRVESGTNTHMLFVDAGNNRVGINAGSTPSSIFHILDSANVNSIVQTTGANGEAYHSYINDVNQWRSGVFGTDDYRITDVTNSEGRLAIYAGSEMVVNEDGNDRDFRVESDTNSHALFVNAADSVVLIGKSATDNSTAGIRFNMDGSGSFAKDGNLLYLNRKTSNGEFITFARDNVSVGQIGSHAGDYLTIGEGASALIFNVSTSSVRPWNMDNTTSPDAVVNLGATNGRFNQLHLSGATYYGLSGTDQFVVGKSGADNRIWDRSGGDIEFLTGDLQRFIIKNSEVVVNDDSYDVNFRVESNGNANMLFVDGGNNTVGIGDNAPTEAGLVIASIGTDANTSARLALKSNETSVDTYLRFGRFGTGDDASFTIANNYYRTSSTYVADDTSWGPTAMYFGDGEVSFSTNQAGTASPLQRMVIKQSEVVVNEQGYDNDFRVESDDRSHMFFVDAGTDRVGVNSSAPSGIFEVFALPSGGTTSNLINFIAQDGGNQNSDSPVLHLGATGQTNGVKLQGINVDAYGKKDLVFYMNSGTDYATSTEKIRFRYQGGITFNGDTAEANALDDYEEGTWTPSLAGATGETYSTQQGFYTKIGNHVTCQFYMALSGAPTGGSNVNIVLPFAPRGSVTSIHGGRLLRADALTVSDDYAFHISPYNGSTAAFIYNTSGGVLNYIGGWGTGVISASFVYTT